MTRFWLGAALLLAFIGCGPSPRAGGSGVDIPNSFTITVSQSNGAPAVNVKVRVVALSHWADLVAAGKPVILDSMITDAHGKFVVTNPGTARVNLEVVSNHEGTSFAFDTSLEKLELHSLGQVRAQWNAKATVRIFGTSFAATAGSDGFVNMVDIPSMNSGLVGLAANQTPTLLNSFMLNAGDSLNLGLLQPIRDSLLVDDFENNSIATPLNPWFKGSFWFSIADENDGGKSTVIPSTAKSENWLTALSDSDVAAGHSLTIHYSVHPVAGVPSFVIAGCLFGFGINGDAFDSLKFQVHSDAPYTLTNGALGRMHFSATVQDWETVVVPRSALDSAGITGEVGLLQFVFQDTTGSVFRLDNFRIFGNPFQMLQSAK